VKSTSTFIFFLLFAGQFCKAQELTEINCRISSNAFAINAIVFTLNGLDVYINSRGDIFPVNPCVRKRNGWQAVAHENDEKYYDNFESDEKVGKIKSINGITIDYYDKFSNKMKIGKVKSIGNTNIDYYDNFDNGQKTGKIKSIGNIVIDYYDSFERNEKKGKIKSFGNYTIDYYDTFSGNMKEGKLSTIGPIKIDYYDQFSSSDKIGKIKSIKGNTQAFYVTVVDKWRMSDFDD
jgi:hypothetical protein